MISMTVDGGTRPKIKTKKSARQSYLDSKMSSSPQSGRILVGLNSDFSSPDRLSLFTNEDLKGEREILV